MAGNIRLQVVTPEKNIVDDDVQTVVSPGSMGEFGVLVGHTPFMTTLKTGVLKYTDAGGKDQLVFVSGGFAEALPDKVTILAESAEKQADIDIARAEAARDRAQARLDEAKADLDFARAKAALERALFRLRMAGRN